jgi:hypothetical protein
MRSGEFENNDRAMLRHPNFWTLMGLGFIQRMILNITINAHVQMRRFEFCCRFMPT